MPNKRNSEQGYIPQWLAELRSGEGLRTPEGYFDSLSEQIEDRLLLEEAGIPAKSEDEFKAPKGHLKEMRESIEAQTGESLQEDNMSVPPGFFEQMQADINIRIEQEEEEEEEQEQIGKGESAFAEASSGKQEQIREEETKVVSIVRWKRVMIPLAAAAAILAAIFIWQVPEDECETFACLLERTEIGYEDLEYFTTDELEVFFENEDPASQSPEDDEMLDYLIESELDIEDLLEDYE